MLQGTVAEAMTTQLGSAAARIDALRELAVSPDHSLAEASERMAEADVNVLPVTSGGKVVGVLWQSRTRAYFALEDRLGFPLANIVDDVSPNDLMFEGNLTTYLTVGASALQRMRWALEQARTPRVSQILDFACGHGRVLRMLKAAFPEATLTACDVDPDAMRFCARTFGAKPVLSSSRISEIELEGGFDLIWSGSLLTHLDEGAWDDALAFFGEHLAKSGTLVFTTHGPWGAERLRSGELAYGLPRSAIDNLLQRYDETGFGFADYEGETGYGIAVCSPKWVSDSLTSHPGLKQVAYEEAAWAAHQDVVVCST